MDGTPQFQKLRVPKIHKSYGMKLEAKTFYQGPNEDDSDNNINWVENPSSQLPSNTRQRFDSAAMQIFKTIDKDKTFNNVPTYTTSFIKVQSPILIDHLKSLLSNTDTVFGEKQIRFDYPFQPLYFAWNDIEAAYHDAKQTSDPEEFNHLAVLWKFMEDELGETFERVTFQRKQGRISYDLLWSLFPQGDYVLSTWDGFQQTYRVLSCGKKDSSSASSRDYVWVIRCEYVQFDGYEYGFSEMTLTMPYFYDTKPITSLRIYPWTFVDEAKSQWDKLVQRGRAVLDFQGCDYKFYDGIALEPQNIRGHHGDYHGNQLDTFMWPASKFNVVSRIIIDPYLYARSFESYRRQIRSFTKLSKPESRINAPTHRMDLYSDPTPEPRAEKGKMHRLMAKRGRPDKDKQLMNQKDVESKEEHLFLMSPLLDGFSLNEKRWFNFLIEWVKPLVLESRAFEELVLPLEYKDLVLAFAKQQDEKVQEVDDIISGKGQGLMILLSGPPGTGKTLTAEAVADKVGRPLYHVDTHELGQGVEDLSIKLREIMNVAAEWNAIVLLDEADVFLQKRSPENYERNQRVAVFLRELEYYRGSMFLTTNILTNIDEAMESRVHVHIVFEALLSPSRLRIWTNFLQKLPAYNVSITDSDIEELARWTLNGRQIKNAVQMATKWCSRVQLPLNIQNIENVIRLTCPKASNQERR